MLDQIVIGGKGSSDDFGASVMTRNIKDPDKKKITKTVPFSNQTYDFTAINGEIYWNQRELEYVFEMIAPCPEDLEAMKTAFSNYVMNIIEEPLHDPFVPDYHFIATFESKSYDDDESGLKTTMAVTFLAYPYKVANKPKKYTVTIEPGAGESVTVYNGSSHRVTPTIAIEGSVGIVFGDVYYSASDGTVVSDKLALNPGNNTMYLTNAGAGTCTVEIRFREEVF